jgi:hypothetical protein
MFEEAEFKIWDIIFSSVTHRNKFKADVGPPAHLCWGVHDPRAQSSSHFAVLTSGSFVTLM